MAVDWSRFKDKDLQMESDDANPLKYLVECTCGWENRWSLKSCAKRAKETHEVECDDPDVSIEDDGGPEWADDYPEGDA